MKYYGQFQNNVLIGVSRIPLYADDFENKEISQEEFDLFMSKEEEKQSLIELRVRREQECFLIVNRGKLWYDNLTEEQLIELNTWYNAWLDVTETRVVPETPSWIK